MKAGRALRRAVLNRLIAEVPDLGGRVYDRATETDGYPYVTLGPSYWTDDDADCIEGGKYALQVDVWCSGGAGSGKGNAEDMVGDVKTALKGWMDQDAVTAHPAEIVLVRVMDDPSGCVHGIVQIEIEVEDHVA